MTLALALWKRFCRSKLNVSQPEPAAGANIGLSSLYLNYWSINYSRLPRTEGMAKECLYILLNVPLLSPNPLTKTCTCPAKQD